MRWVQSHVSRVIRGDSGQDAFDYMLVGGVLAVVMALALFAFDEVIPDFVGHSCSSVNTAAADPDDCLTPTPATPTP